MLPNLGVGSGSHRIRVFGVATAIYPKLFVPEGAVPIRLSAAPVSPNLAKSNAQGPDIRRWGGGMSPLYLGRGVECGPAARHPPFDCGSGRGKPKVTEKEIKVITSVHMIVHDVFGLDISVYHSLCVKIGEGRKHLGGKLDPYGREWAPALTRVLDYVGCVALIQFGEQLELASDLGTL
jgi:hypothetical protein